MEVSESEIRGCPYEYKKAKFMSPLLRGYWVTFYLIFDGTSFTHCFNKSDLLDNADFARECGFKPTLFTERILVTPDSYPEIFNVIESYVSRSN